MADLDLRTDYKDDILDSSVNEKRKYNLVDSDGNIVAENVSLVDNSIYNQKGDSFGAVDINKTNQAVLDLNQSLNVKYDVEKDMLQIYYNGEWVDWKSASLQWDGTIFGNGAFSPKQPITSYSLVAKGGDDGGKYETASVSISDGMLTFASHMGNTNGVGHNQYMIYCPDIALNFDTLKYSSITIRGKHTHWESITRWYLQLFKNIPSLADSPILNKQFINVASYSGSVTTDDFSVTIPIENVTGEKYLCFRNDHYSDGNRYTHLKIKDITFNV